MNKIGKFSEKQNNEDFFKSEANMEKWKEVNSRLQKLWESKLLVSTPEELENLEREIRRNTEELNVLLVERHVQAGLNSEEQKKKEKNLIESFALRMKNEGYEEVRVRTAGGLYITVYISYFRRRCDRRKGKRYKGIYPGLVLLGIHQRCTPLLGSTVSSWAALLSSFKEVKQIFFEQGIDFSVKVIRNLTYRYAERARLFQQTCTDFLSNEVISGRRVVVSCDGGRIRLRENKRGPKTEKGRTRYHGAWREPKLLIIYVVDAEGKLEHSFAPLIDCTLKGPDALFKLIQGYLQSLEIQKADKVLFVADGARWIWIRVAMLIKSLRISQEQVCELVDFYHAVEHLGKVASLRRNWTPKERKTWIQKQRRHLLKNEVMKVVDAVRAICRGRNGKAITTEMNYFVKNINRMAYSTMKNLKLPQGSGAVESAVRRVINLRLKSPGVFWYQENAEKIMMLRSYYKAGRWDVLRRMANSPRSTVLT